MRRTAAEIANIVGGDLHGDPSVEVRNVAGLPFAGEGDVSFAQKTRLGDAAACRASVLIVPQPVEGFAGAQIVAPDPYRAFVRLLEDMAAERRVLPQGIHASAVVDETAALGPGVALGANVTVGKGAAIGANTVICAGSYVGAYARLGEDCVIHPNVTLLARVSLGDRVIVHPNTAIGGDGFGYLDHTRANVKVPQVGRVEIGNDVEIGCNCTVDRATMDATVIGNNVKIDNHSHVAHNVRIGDNSVLVAYARIGGGTVIGRNVLLAEDVGITDNVTVGDGCIVAGTGKVSKDTPAGMVVWGNPAQEMRAEKRERAALRKLPRMMEELRNLKRLLKAKGIGDP